MWPRLRLFLSHAAHDDAVSQRIDLALREAGHDVFFDRESLAAGEGYHQRIRDEIARADLVVFLVSSASLREGSYCRTEMEITEARWPHPHGRVLPVLLEPLPSSSLPPYVTAVTYLAPRGNVVADTIEAVDRLARPLRRRRRAFAGAAATLALLAVVGVPLVAQSRAATLASLPDDLGRRARLVRASGDGTFLVAAAAPDELVELRGDGTARTLIGLDAEPVALAHGGAPGEDELIAVATRSATPLHVLKGPARDPLGPFEAPAKSFAEGAGASEFSTRPVEIAVHDGRVWCVLGGEGALSAFDALLPEQGTWQLGFYGSYARDQVTELGRAVEGARLCDLGGRLVVVQRVEGRTRLSLVAGDVLPWHEEPADVLGCVRDLAPGPADTFYAVTCDLRLVRVARDAWAGLESRPLAALGPLPDATALDVDHRIVADGTRVVVAFNAREAAPGARPVWTRLIAYEPARGVRALEHWERREIVSLAVSADRCLVVLRDAGGAWSSGVADVDPEPDTR